MLKPANYSFWKKPSCFSFNVNIVNVHNLNTMFNSGN